MKLDEAESHMQKAVEAAGRAFNTIRTGRASASLLDRVMVDYYGAPTSLKSLASINTPDATTIAIQPYDRNNLSPIEKAISTSDVGLTPNNDGSVIRLNIPALTSERRQEFVKMAGKFAEEQRVSVRNMRRDAIESARKEEKKGELSKDESRDVQDKIQKLTDKYIAKIDKLLADKEEDINKI